MTVALVNQEREKTSEKRSPGLKSEKEALLIGMIIQISFLRTNCLLASFCFAHVFACTFALINEKRKLPFIWIQIGF